MSRGFTQDVQLAARVREPAEVKGGAIAVGVQPSRRHVGQPRQHRRPGQLLEVRGPAPQRPAVGRAVDSDLS